MISVLIAVLLAALVYALCLALGLPAIVGIIAAILVLLAGIPTGGYGLGRRWGVDTGRRRVPRAAATGAAPCRAPLLESTPCPRRGESKAFRSWCWRSPTSSGRNGSIPRRWDFPWSNGGRTVTRSGCWPAGHASGCGTRRWDW